MTTAIDSTSTVEFPLLASSTLNGGNITVERRPDGLDLAKVVLLRGQAVNIPDETPTVVWWGKPGVTSYVAGYVAGRETLRNAGNEKAEPYVVLTIVGAGLPLKASSERSWQHCTATNAVSDLLLQHRLTVRFWVKNDPVMQNLQTGNRSDLRFLHDLFHQLGWAGAWKGTTLLVSDRSDPVARARSGQAGVADLDVREAPHVEKRPLQLVERRAGTVDSRTGQVVWQHPALTGLVAEPQEAKWVRHVGTTGADLNEAQAQITGAQAGERWTQHAQVIVAGDPSLAPGDVVQIRGSMNPDADGLWFVEHAVHRIRHDKPYLSELKLGRDNDEWLYPAGAPTTSAGIPPYLLLGTKWVSAWET